MLAVSGDGLRLGQLFTLHLHLTTGTKKRVIRGSIFFNEAKSY